MWLNIWTPKACALNLKQYIQSFKARTWNQHLIGPSRFAEEKPEACLAKHPAGKCQG